MTAGELAGRIDHTLLAPEASDQDIDRVIREAIEHRFASVCVAPAWVRKVSSALRDSGIRTCSVVGFPHGNHKSTVKAIEATSVIKDGADEIDVVAFLPHLLKADEDACRTELLEIVRAARAARRDVVVKVIVESALLMRDASADQQEQRIAAACRAVLHSGCDFIKTSTGFHAAGGASIQAVRLIKQHARGLQIKAAGGIRDLPAALAMLEAGADRLGCSASVKILSEINAG